MHRGDLQDLDSLRNGATGMDAVVNLAFEQDMSKFAESSENEMKAIEALGSALEPGKLLLVTSGVFITAGGPGHLRKETDPAINSPEIPRKGNRRRKPLRNVEVHAGVLRMSQVHDTRKQELVMFLIQIARERVFRRTWGMALTVGRRLL